MGGRQPYTYEDHAIEEFHRTVGGRIYREVSIRTKSIDAVRLIDWPRLDDKLIRFKNHQRELDVVLNQMTLEKYINRSDPPLRNVQLVEVGTQLNWKLIGELEGKGEFFKEQYNYDHLSYVILCEAVDAVIKQACHLRGIEVKRILGPKREQDSSQ